MGKQFSSNFLTLYLIALFFLPLPSPPSHLPEWLLSVVLGIFFVNSRFWWHSRVVKTGFYFSVAISLLLLVSSLMATLPMNWIAVWRLILPVVSLPLALWLREKFGKQFLGVAFLAMILFWAQWGGLQFLLQHDLGLTILGESNLSPTLPAVAKFAWRGDKILRAYGPFSHANIFGGVMLLGLASSLFLHKRILSAISLLLLLGLILAFSRSAYLGLLIFIIASWFIYRVRWKVVPLASFILFFILSPWIIARLTDSQDQAILERLTGLTWWHSLAMVEPFRGVGFGNYSAALQNFLISHNVAYEAWQIAPVHSVPLLAVLEWGPWVVIVMAMVTVATAWKLRRQFDFRVIGLILAVTGPAWLVDHYFLTQAAPLTLLVTALVCFGKWDYRIG